MLKDKKSAKNQRSSVANYYFVGMPGSGKTKIGKLVANAMNLDFFDSDVMVEKRAGKTIPEIFFEDGETEFRKIESEIIAGLYLRENFVASLGGGAVLSKGNWEWIRRSGKTIWLDAAVETLFARLQRKNHRPLFPADNQFEYIQTTLELRNPLYKMADFRFETTNSQSPKKLAEKIVEVL